MKDRFYINECVLVEYPNEDSESALFLFKNNKKHFVIIFEVFNNGKVVPLFENERHELIANRTCQESITRHKRLN